MSIELALCLVTLFGLAGIGTPIGYSIILASLVYLGLAGLDVALTGEKILQGLYKVSFCWPCPCLLLPRTL